MKPKPFSGRNVLIVPVIIRVCLVSCESAPDIGAEGGVPIGIRTRVLALKGPRPRPLDDGDDEVETSHDTTHK